MLAYCIYFFLVYLSLVPSFAYGNGWYLDASCDSRRDLFKKGMKQAFLMAESALAAIGTPPAQPGGAVEWVFPEKETRDMAARIFGTAFEVSFERKDTYQVTTMKKFSVVRDTLGYIVEQFKNPTDDPKAIPLDASGYDARYNIGEGGIIFYCDLKRWTPMPDNSRYRNRISNMEGSLELDVYDNCLNDNGNMLGFASNPPANYYVGLQICPARLILDSEFPDTLDRSKVASNMRFFRLLDREPNKQTLDDFKKIDTEDIMEKFKAMCSRKSKAEPDKLPIVDIYKGLFEMTLFHEMTHAVTPEWRSSPEEPTNEINKKYPNRFMTVDQKVGSEKGYGWKNVWKLKDGKGWNNADSYTYFGMASRFLKERAYRTKFNGCPEKIGGGWNFDYQMTSGTKEPVGAGWNPPNAKRSESYQHLLIPSQPDERSSKLPPYPMVRREGFVEFSAGFITTVTSLGTGIASPITSISHNTTGGGTAPFHLRPRTSQILSSTFDLSTWQSVTSSSTASPSSIVNPLSGTISPLSSTVSPLPGINTSPLSMNTSLSDGAKLPPGVNTLPSSMNNSLLSGSTSTSLVSTSLAGTISPPWNSSSLNRSVPVSTSMVSRTAGVPISNTPRITSTSAMSSSTVTGTASSRVVESLLSSFWSKIPTALSSGNMAAAFCTNPLLDGCVLPTAFSIEKLVTATEADIPEITDISIFPHIDVGGVPVVKLNLPKDTCARIPKPSGSGLFGGLFKVASNIVNGVLDAACNIEIPVVKDGKLPKWFNFGSFPHPASFQPVPLVVGPPQEPGKPEKPTPDESPKSTQRSESPTSASSSCRQTVFSSCDVSRFVSSTVTRASQSCSTTKACSGVDITKVTATTWSCSPTAIQVCRGTAFVSGSGMTSFATACSTKSTCSGSGATSIKTLTSSAAVPEVTYIIDEEETNIMEQRMCVLRLLEFKDEGINEAEYFACYGEMVDPSASINISSSSMWASITRSTSSGTSASAPGSASRTAKSSTVSPFVSSSSSSTQKLLSSGSSSVLRPQSTLISASQSASQLSPKPTSQSSVQSQPEPTFSDGVTPMNDCKKKDGVCYCQPKFCFSGPGPASDCYTVKAEDCDAECKGCHYPNVKPPQSSRALSSSPPSPKPSSSAPPPPKSTGRCPGSTPMRDCKKKDGKCMCKPKSCLLTPDAAYDCYNVQAVDCDDSCQGCWYPSPMGC